MHNALPLRVIGNLVDEPELRFTGAGVAVARFAVASTPWMFDRDANAMAGRGADVHGLQCLAAVGGEPGRLGVQGSPGRGGGPATLRPVRDPGGALPHGSGR